MASGPSDLGLGQLKRLPIELRFRVYRYYFANALVYPDYPQPPRDDGSDIPIWVKTYQRSLVLTSTTIFEEASVAERSATFVLDMCASDEAYVPLCLRRNAVEIIVRSWADDGFAAHSFPKLKELHFTAEGWDFIWREYHETPVDDCLKGKLDADIIKEFKDQTEEHGSPVARPELLPEDLVIQVEWYCFHFPESRTMDFTLKFQAGEWRVVDRKKSEYQEWMSRHREQN